MHLVRQASNDRQEGEATAESEKSWRNMAEWPVHEESTSSLGVPSCARKDVLFDRRLFAVVDGFHKISALPSLVLPVDAKS